MDLLGLIRVFARHWLLTVPILSAALVLAVVIQSAAPAEYEASGSVVLTEPPLDPSTDPVSLTRPATIARQVRQSSAFEELALADDTTSVAVDGTDDGTLQISVTGAPEADMEQEAVALADLAAQLITDVQQDADVPEDERIAASVQRAEVVPTGGSTAAGDQAFAATTEVFLDDPSAGAENPLTASVSTARLLQVAAQSDAAQQEVESRTDQDISFEVDQDLNDRAPILEVFVFAGSDEAAVDNFDVVADMLADDLDDRQERAGVRSTDRLVLDTLAAPLDARDVSPPVSRTAAVIVALGVLLAFGAAILAENARPWLDERRQHRASGRSPWAADDDGPEQEAGWAARSPSRVPDGDRRSGLNPPGV